MRTPTFDVFSTRSEDSPRASQLNRTPWVRPPPQHQSGTIAISADVEMVLLSPGHGVLVLLHQLGELPAPLLVLHVELDSLVQQVPLEPLHALGGEVLVRC